MKRLWMLLLFMCCFITSQAQVINATGFAAKLYSVTLGGYTWAVSYSEFSTPTLPHDAVIQGIYPVLIQSGNYDIAFQIATYGNPSLPMSDPAHGPQPFTIPYNTNPINPGASYSSTEFYAPSIGTSLTKLFGQGIGSALNSSLELDPTTDTVTVTGVGYAIYYTSATPTTDPLMPPPFSVPGGQGLAWSVPESCGLEGPPAANGTVVCTPAMTGTTSKPITGLLVDPNGNGVNGSVNIRLPVATIKNICTPGLVVPTVNVTYPVVNGLIQAPKSNFVSNDCMYPRLAYNITVNDNNNNFIYNDNWYLPRNLNFAYDVGSFSYTNFGGPITVQIPQGIISNPSANQIITQPTGTSLNLVGTILINGVTFATAAGGITYTGVLQTSPSTSQVVTQPGGTFLNLVGDIRINGTTFGTGVTSFNTRAGAVSPANGDYACSQISGALCVGSSFFYQTVKANGTNQTQEPALNFSTAFVLSDTSSVSTNVGLNSTGVTPGTYNSPSQIIVGSDGRVSSVTAGGPTVASQDIIITSGICTTGSAAYAQCTTGTFSWPTPFSSTSYTITCAGFNPSATAITGLFVTNKTTAGFELILQNGDSSGAHAVTLSEVDCHGSHL